MDVPLQSCFNRYFDIFVVISELEVSVPFYFFSKRYFQNFIKIGSLTSGSEYFSFVQIETAL